MSEQVLEPAERLALMIARAQVDRGDNPPLNTTAVLVLTIERLTAALAAAQAQTATERTSHGEDND